MFVWNGINVDPYKIFEVSHDVSKEELGAKYKKLARKYHTDNGIPTKRSEDGIRLVNQARAEILKDIELRDKIAQEKAVKEDDYSTLDLEGIKKAVITKCSNYITDCQVAKVTCELYQGKTLGTVKDFFDQGIAVANNCITLTNISTSKEEVLRVKKIFDTKRAKFDDNFFSDLEKLLNKSIVLIRGALEVQTLMRLIKERDKEISAQEWFNENQDALITLVSFEEDLVKKLDDILEEFKQYEYYEYISDEVDEKCSDAVVEVNTRIAEVHQSYKVFEEGDFAGAFRIELQRIVDKYNAIMERRKNKIKYLKFARDISDETVEQLESFIHDEVAFNSMVDAIEMPLFKSHVGAAQGTNVTLAKTVLK